MPSQLDPDRVIQTIGKLQRRISERFPNSSLSKVADQVRQIADAARQRAHAFRRANVGLRLAVMFVLLTMVGFIVAVALSLRFDEESGWGVLQGIEASISSIVFLGAAAVFLLTLETRVKRRKVLGALEELRELAHIIDMHQLVKDPERVCRDHVRTESSPTESLTPFLLGRYLDYCSELLALIGKVAVIYTQGVHDSVALAGIDSVETLTTGLCRKIWQKMIILDGIRADHERGVPADSVAKPTSPTDEQPTGET